MCMAMFIHIAMLMEKKENIGFAKVKAVMDSLKDENTLLLDNGDVLEGSPLSFYHFHSHSKIFPQ